MTKEHAEEISGASKPTYIEVYRSIKNRFHEIEKHYSGPWGIMRPSLRGTHKDEIQNLFRESIHLFHLIYNARESGERINPRLYTLNKTLTQKIGSLLYNKRPR